MAMDIQQARDRLTGLSPKAREKAMLAFQIVTLLKDGYTLEEIGDMIGVTRERVRQIAFTLGFRASDWQRAEKARLEAIARDYAVKTAEERARLEAEIVREVKEGASIKEAMEKRGMSQTDSNAFSRKHKGLSQHGRWHGRQKLADWILDALRSRGGIATKQEIKEAAIADGRKPAAVNVAGSYLIGKGKIVSQYIENGGGHRVWRLVEEQKDKPIGDQA